MQNFFTTRAPICPTPIGLTPPSAALPHAHAIFLLIHARAFARPGAAFLVLAHAAFCRDGCKAGAQCDCWLLLKESGARSTVDEYTDKCQEKCVDVRYVARLTNTVWQWRDSEPSEEAPRLQKGLCILHLTCAARWGLARVRHSAGVPNVTSAEPGSPSVARVSTGNG